MLTPARALAIALSACPRLPEELVELSAAAGRVLARPLRARRGYPAFDNSAMDGWALRSADARRVGAQEVQCFSVAGVSAAGQPYGRRLLRGQAVRIYTGAPLPAGADTIVAQEDAQLLPGRLCVLGPIRKGRHVRLAGEDFGRGAQLAKAGQRVDSRWLALLTASGYAKVPCLRSPRVALFATGTELARPGSRLKGGQIYDTNSPMLAALLASSGARVRALPRLPDDLERLVRALKRAASRADMVVLSGGVSAGDRDLVRPALSRAGGRELFWKVAQKPGKPLFFARLGRVPVFGLPGNPVAAFACLMEYVAPCLRAMQGLEPRPPQHRLPLGQAFENEERKTLFLRARSQGGRLHLLKGQGSHQLLPLARAHGLAVIPSQRRLRPGDELRFHPFGWAACA